MKITIELDLDNPSDNKLLELISKWKAQIAQGAMPSIPTVLAPPPAPTQAGSTHSLIDEKVQVGKEMTVVANELLKQAGGPGGKMNTIDRAKLAADARWAKYRADKEAGKPAAPKSKSKKKAPKPTVNSTGAVEIPVEDFPTRRAQDMVLSSLEPQSPFPDGREILEGTFQNRESHIPPEYEVEVDDDADDEFVKEVQTKAKGYERER